LKLGNINVNGQQMSDIAIRVENLSKQYRIGGPQARYKTIRESLTEAVQAPFRRLSSVVRGQSSAVANETIWALKDVSLEVKRGDVVGGRTHEFGQSGGFRDH
jgi:lipopolysaccharide transport system ATP-binding protein